MDHFYESDAAINASPETVWSVLVDSENYPNWDSGIESVEGKVAEGETVTVHSKANPGRAFPVKVTGVEENCCMMWVGGLPLGTFTGVRTFHLEETGGGETLFKMREEYHGPLVGLMWKAMPDLQPSFDQFAKGLKARAEELEAAEVSVGGGQERDLEPSRPPHKGV
ncbi:MAG: SRPBCC domain-containing protein [Coriobacteriales bacterium]|nr:SRPBCC domain-containing protein [Coriobacteriales bacterium]